MIGRFKHVKRGTVYIADHVMKIEGFVDEGDHLMFVTDDGLALARVQSSGGKRTGKFVIYYEDDEMAEYWARPYDEFFDGRFEAI